ncbi:MAG: type I DNA topoisomerase [Dehalococcoidia bacterium]|nr:type I DNA topoisomerase [Dehalococcoidia bacterium]
MAKDLVIVESPAKARTITKILGSRFVVKASVGHVMDLPESKLGIDISNNFTPQYVVSRDKKKVVNELKKAAGEAKYVYLATDPDREGEAISWHITQAAKIAPGQIRRVVFHEITKEAVQEAFKHSREINMPLVNAQQARRLLDRLVGYKISPLLWRKIRKGLSAGRVQSVAVKIIVDREREILGFVKKEYWTIEAELNKLQGDAKESFRAQLIKDGSGKKVEIPGEKEAEALRSVLEKSRYSVSNVSLKEALRQPAPPFITSTLQQEASRKLGFSAKQTMALAQQLYEGLPLGEEGTVGLITYMRTDSTRVAQQAIAETRDFISEKFGSNHLPPHSRQFTRKAKGAQEAHEAIRPTRIHREPASVKPFLASNQYKLYDLIWKRMVASQMAAAVFQVTTVEVKAESESGGKSYLFRTVCWVSQFPGFMSLYIESKDENDDEQGKASLPQLTKGEKLKLIKLFPEQHFTQPPQRYSEATLIKALEDAGIGRPSTYAPIISTIQDREYVKKVQGRFQPEDIGITVNDLLVAHFGNIVDLNFTARIEEELDEIARGEREWVPMLKEFYEPFEITLDQAYQNIEKVKIEPEATGEPCPTCGKPLVIRSGRFGKFVACSDYPNCKFTKPLAKKLDVKCPHHDCGGDLLERRSKKKKIFYGCSNYPDCKFTTGRRPVSMPCPECKGLLTEYGKNSVKCTGCDYKGALEVKEPAAALNS